MLVILVKLAGLLRPLPLKCVTAVYVIDDEGALVKAVKGGGVHPGAFQLGLPVVVAHGQNIGAVQIPIGEVGRFTGGTAAQMSLGNGYQLLRAQNPRIVDDLLQCDLLGSTVFTIKHFLLVGCQPNHIMQSPLTIVFQRLYLSVSCSDRTYTNHVNNLQQPVSL